MVQLKVGECVIGEKIKQLRKDHNLSIATLATKANVAKSCLISIERGVETSLSIHFIEKISLALGVSANELIDIEKYHSEPLDVDWLQLVKEAMRSGVTKKDFKNFLNKSG